MLCPENRSTWEEDFHSKKFSKSNKFPQILHHIISTYIKNDIKLKITYITSKTGTL